MNKLIKLFLKKQELHSGQVYKICPDKFLKDFIKFAENSFVERYKVEPEFLNKGFGWILHKNYKGEFERIYMKSKKEVKQQKCKVYNTIEEEADSMKYYGLQEGE